MVSVTSVCGTLLICATLNNVATEEVVAQSTYDTVTKQEFIEIMENGIDPYSPRDLLSEDTQLMLQDYLQYKKQQEELELQRQRELEMKTRQKAIEEQYSYKGYRQTYYSVIENNETELGSGYDYKSPEVKNIDNVMHFNDSEFGWIPIYAIDMNEVTSSGQNEQGTWNVYGSVIELRFEDGSVNKGIVLDACGACRYSPKIDLWTYRNQQSLDMSNIDFRYIRYGWGR